MELDSDIVFWTFSTIPQVLAGAIALLGAFWVFQVRELNSELIYAGAEILEEIEKPSEVKILSKKGDEEFLRTIYRQLKSTIHHRHFKNLEARINNIAKLLPDNNSIKDFKGRHDDAKKSKSTFTITSVISIIFSSVTILLSVAILVATNFHVITCCNHFAYEALLLFTLFLFFVSICITSYTIIRTLIHKPSYS